MEGFIRRWGTSSKMRVICSSESEGRRTSTSSVFVLRSKDWVEDRHRSRGGPGEGRLLSSRYVKRSPIARQIVTNRWSIDHTMVAIRKSYPWAPYINRLYNENKASIHWSTARTRSINQLSCYLIGFT